VAGRPSIRAEARCRRRSRSAFALSLALALPSCSSSTETPASTVSIALTDSPLDDLDMFEVDVTSLSFEKLLGGTVTALAKRTRIDFTELEDLGDLVARANLESGAYRRLVLTLDFASATVWLKDKTTPATVVGVDGTALTGTLEVPIDFAAADRPRVAPGRNHLFLLDLDLDQAVTVDASANRVTFAPVVSVEFDPTNPKPIAANGILKSLDATARSFVIERRTPSGEASTEVTVTTRNATVFQVGGVVSLGQNGITAMQGLTVGSSRVFVQGTFDGDEPHIVAGAVESGAGTPGNGQDQVAGFVTARTGGSGQNATLTVVGRSRVDATGSRTFNTVHTIQTVFGSTKVLRRGAGNSLTTDAPNVGQFVHAFGTLSGTVLDATASTGVVRMLPTSVYGIASGVPAGGTLTLDLSRIGPRPITDFDFTVGGTPEADPMAFTVDVTGLSTTGIASGSKIRAIGFVNPVGIPSDRNFTPFTLVNRSNEANLLVCVWSPLATGVVTPSSTALTLDVVNAAAKSVLDGFGGTPLNPTPPPQVTPLASKGIYRIVEGGAVQVHFGFPAFADALSERLTGSVSVARVTALGRFNADTQTLSAGIVSVVLR
jgi:hypothetical protein